MPTAWLAVIVGIGVVAGWGMFLIALPFAIRHGEFRYWAKEAAMGLYFTAWAVGCLIIRAQLP